MSQPALPPIEDQMKELGKQKVEAGRKINPETAIVEWRFAETLDPYGVGPDLPEDCRQVGREYFARCPKDDVWVHFGDLPEATQSALWLKHKSKLAFLCFDFK